MDIKDINPWWKTGRIDEEYSSFPRRELFRKLLPYVSERQIIAINGLRRMGKTVLMHHLIEFILKKHRPENVLYFSFDLLDDRIENILRSYTELTGVDLRNEDIFVFLDEVQKHTGWENELKVLYDNFRRVKFFISGSSSLFIERKTKESLGGRAFSFTLNPLAFEEYLELRKIRVGSNLSLFEDDLREALSRYLRTGGFPELLSMKEERKIDRYIKELIIDRVVYMDIPKVFEMEEPELLARLLSVISAEPGMIIDYGRLASDLGRNRKTITNYMFYLEKAFLVKKLYNYSRNMLSGERKMKKVYPVSTAFAFLFEAAEGKIMETAGLMNYDFRFFSRKDGKETDFIATGKGDKEILPIELKYAKRIGKKDIRGLFHFIGKHGLERGLVITKDNESQEKINGMTIEYVPMWKWLLEADRSKPVSKT